MHIAFLTSEYPHPKVIHAAGIATSIKNLAVALVKKGVKVTIFAYHQNENDIIESEDVTIHLIKKKTYKLFTWYFYRKQLQNYINKIVKSEVIDLIEAPDWSGITAFMHFKIPLVIRLHGSDAYFCKLDNRKQKFKNFLFEKLALKGADAYITPTTYAGIETQKNFKLETQKIKTIYNGLKLEDFENATPDTYNRNTILYIGTIIRKKGVFELVKIFNKVIESNPHAQLILIGGDAPDIKTGGDSTYKLIASLFSESAKKQVSYLGKIAYNEVKEQIKKAHVCVFPSFAETLGMVTIESMSLQKPVVNTSIGWAQEIINDGVDGYLVHPTDVKMYVKKITDLLNNESLCSKLGKKARERVIERFDIDKNADINITYYNSIIEENTNK